MKSKKVFWGIYFILAGAGIIMNQLGYFGDMNLWTILFLIFLIPIILKSMIHLNFAGILFPLALIGILFAKELGITALTPWPLLVTALFMSIGLSMIFHKKRHYGCYQIHEEHFSNIINQEDENDVEVSVNFGSSIKYVNSKQFEKGYFHCTCGALKVYFDNAVVEKTGATILLDVSFSGVELYIPKEWQIINNTNTTLGGIEEKNRHTISDGPVVTLSGKVSFSGVDIIYI